MIRNLKRALQVLVVALFCFFVFFRALTFVDHPLALK